MSRQRIGGGAKKILYTLNTVRRIGVLDSAKALTAKNTCKACALGMGGQKGGMTNELGEFPSVCNKSVQAQSTDIQSEIPEEVFSHTLNDFKELNAHEIETLGRLGHPVYKEKGSDCYRLIDWDKALEIAAQRLSETEPDRTFFYASGRSSNEAGFIFQLLARAYGTNNVTNCSYYCHQATGVALGSTIGTGTSTVELADLEKCDLIFVIGANPSSNHPRFIHQLKHCRDRGGDVIVINPAKEPGLVKFAIPKSPKSLLSGGSNIASDYLQPRIGSDIAVFKGIAKAILEMNAHDRAFMDHHTIGGAEFIADIEATSWTQIISHCGLSRIEIERVARRYAQSRSAVFAWGMGMTHHVHGVENIEMISALALLRGMIGRPGAGLLPLRGHSNVQGVGTIGVKPVLAREVIAKIEERFGVSLPKKTGLDTMASMQAAHSGNVDAAVMLGGNLFAANPNAVWAAEALGRIGFKLFLTTTLNASHITGVENSECLILPVTARDEEWEPTTQESMFNFVRMSDGGIQRLKNVRPESVILADLATRLLPDCAIDFSTFKRHPTVRAAISEIIPGMQQMASIDVAREEFHIRNRLIHTPVFRTPTGKAYFRIIELPERNNFDGEYTLSTLRSEGQFNSIIYEEADSYRGVETRWSVLLSSKDIEALGIEPGDQVDIRSANGVMKNVETYAFDIPPGDVLAYYPEANVLTGSNVDPRSKTPSFKSTRVTIKRSE